MNDVMKGIVGLMGVITIVSFFLLYYERVKLQEITSRLYQLDNKYIDNPYRIVRLEKIIETLKK